MDNRTILKTISSCYDIKPPKLFMGELQWKYLIRSALRGKNIIILGPSGQGKTLSVQCLVDALGRQEIFYSFNMGGTQDPRASLIGNTHFSKETGTFFQPSPFVTAITKPNAVILLDEMSRAHPDASNIILPVLDYNQRYLRLDEKDGSIVKVAEGVSFIATANVGNEYTNTRVMDRALMDRFTAKIVVDYLTVIEEVELVKLLHPSADVDIVRQISEIAKLTREFFKSSKLSKAISTRSVVEMAQLTIDGFSLKDLAEVVIYTDYSADGGVDSEQTMVKQIVQRFDV